MSDSFNAFRDRYERITIPSIWVAVALSLILHALMLFGWIPKFVTRSKDGLEPGKPTHSLSVRLAPRPSPPPQPPRAAPAPPPVPLVQERAAPVPRPHAPKVAVQQPQPAPRVLAVERPAPATAAAPPKEAPRAPPSEDLASYIEARRRARVPAIDPLPPQASPQSVPVESDKERHNREVAANLGLNQTPSFGEKTRGGGIFQIQRMGYDDAEFFFFGWNKDIRRNTQQMIEVRRGNNPNMEIAVVRRMIVIIREHVNEDFQFESQRLHKEVTLSARMKDTAGLEEFLMREFFWETRQR